MSVAQKLDIFDDSALHGRVIRIVFGARAIKKFTEIIRRHHPVKPHKFPIARLSRCTCSGNLKCTKQKVPVLATSKRVRFNNPFPRSVLDSYAVFISDRSYKKLKHVLGLSFLGLKTSGLTQEV